jgi:hypothetical protein
MSPRSFVVTSEEFFCHRRTGKIGKAVGDVIPGENETATQKLEHLDGTTGEYPITELDPTVPPAGHKPKFKPMVFTEVKSPCC